MRECRWVGCCEVDYSCLQVLQVNTSTVIIILDSITPPPQYKFVLKWRRKRRNRYEIIRIPDKQGEAKLVLRHKLVIVMCPLLPGR